MSLLELRGLTTAFRTGREEVSAIEDVGMGLNLLGDGLRDVLSVCRRLRIQQ